MSVRTVADAVVYATGIAVFWALGTSTFVQAQRTGDSGLMLFSHGLFLLFIVGSLVHMLYEKWQTEVTEKKQQSDNSAIDINELPVLGFSVALGASLLIAGGTGIASHAFVVPSITGVLWLFIVLSALYTIGSVVGLLIPVLYIENRTDVW